MARDAFKVGELSKRTGVSVRTLHHYDDIGLLSPQSRAQGDHRLYGRAEVERLQQIVSLRRLGFSLQEIGRMLDDPDLSLAHVIRLHLTRLRERIAQQTELEKRLDHLASSLDAAEEVSVDTIVQTIEATTMMENYYTKEQLDTLKQRAEDFGPEAIERAQNEWKELFERYAEAHKQGLPPDDPSVQTLARKSKELIGRFTGGDRGIERSLGNMYNTEGAPKVMAQHGWNIDQDVFDYMQQAMAALPASPDA